MGTVESQHQKFFEISQKLYRAEQLTLEILRMFVEKVVVHAPDRSSGHRTQQIDIHYNFVGQLDMSVETTKARRRSKAEMDTQFLPNQQSL